MKTTNLTPGSTRRHGEAATTGDRSPRLAGSQGVGVRDATSQQVRPVRLMTFRGAHIVDLDDGEVEVQIGIGTSLPLNTGGDTLEFGTVVVIEAGDLIPTTTERDTRVVGIVQRSTDDTLDAPALFTGYVEKVLTTGTVNEGEYLETSTSSGLAKSGGATARTGSFAVALEDGPDPSALMLGTSNPPTTAGEVTYDNSGSGLAAVDVQDAIDELAAAGASGSGCKAYNSTTQAVTSATPAFITFDSEEFDVGGYHSTASNTSRMTIPTGLGGLFLLRAFAYDGNSANCLLRFYKNGTSYLRGTNVYSTLGHESVVVTQLAQGDYIQAEIVPGFTGNIGHASALEAQSTFEILRFGT